MLVLRRGVSQFFRCRSCLVVMDFFLILSKSHNFVEFELNFDLPSRFARIIARFKVEWYTTFRMIGFALCLILLRIPIAQFSLIFTWQIWSFYWRCSSNNTQRYFTDSDGFNLFPSSTNLKLWSTFAAFLWKIINSICEILRLRLFSLSHCERLL